MDISLSLSLSLSLAGGNTAGISRENIVSNDFLTEERRISSLPLDGRFCFRGGGTNLHRRSKERWLWGRIARAWRIISAIHKYNGRTDGEGAGWKWMNPKTVRALKDEPRGWDTVLWWTIETNKSLGGRSPMTFAIDHSQFARRDRWPIEPRGGVPRLG